MRTAESEQRFTYFVEPSRRAIQTATIAVIVLVILALILPSAVLRVILLAFAAGPGLWLGLERLRRGRGVLLADDHLVIEYPYTRRTKRIDYADILAHTITESRGLAIGYRRHQQGATEGTTDKPVALTQ